MSFGHWELPYRTIITNAGTPGDVIAATNWQRADQRNKARGGAEIQRITGTGTTLFLGIQTATDPRSPDSGYTSVWASGATGNGIKDPDSTLASVSGRDALVAVGVGDLHLERHRLGPRQRVRRAHGSGMSDAGRRDAVWARYGEAVDEQSRPTAPPWWPTRPNCASRDEPTKHPGCDTCTTCASTHDPRAGVGSSQSGAIGVPGPQVIETPAALYTELRTGPIVWRCIGSVPRGVSDGGRALRALLEAGRRTRLDAALEREGYPSFAETVLLRRDDSLWIVADLDWSLIEPLPSTSGADDQDELHDDSASGSPYAAPTPHWSQVRDLGWTDGNCFGADWIMHDSEDRSAVAGPDLLPRQLQAVKISAEHSCNYRPTGGKNCTIKGGSGALVSAHAVLTCAHALIDPNGTVIPSGSVTVRVGGPAYTVDHVSLTCGIIFYKLPSPFDLEDDLAMIGATEALGSIHGTMGLSQASDKEIKNTRLHNLGWPGFVDGALCNASGGLQYFQAGDVNKPVPKRVLKTKLDASDGNSGGPIFICKKGDPDLCAKDDRAWVVGVMAKGKNKLVGGWTGGPKVPFYRPWILAVALALDILAIGCGAVGGPVGDD